MLKEREANGSLGHLGEFKKNFDSTSLLCLNERADDSDSELDDELDKRSSILSNEEHLNNAINNFRAENLKSESPSNSKNSQSIHSNNSMMNSNNNLVMRLEMNQIANAAVAHALKNNLLANKSISLGNSQLPIQSLANSTPSNSTSVVSSNQMNNSINNKITNEKNLRKMDIPSLIDNLNMKTNNSANNLSSTNSSLLNNPFISSPFIPKFNHPFDSLWKHQSNQNFFSLRYPIINSINSNANEGQG